MDPTVDEEAASQVTHAAQVRFVGDGPIPEALTGFNWNALAWGALWTLVYRVWPWFWLLFGARILTGIGFLATFAFLRRTAPPGTPGWLPGVLMVVFALPSAALTVRFGFVANRRLWAKEAARPKDEALLPLAPFIRAQRRWLIVWIVITVVASAWELYGARRDAASAAETWANLALVAFMFGGVWLWQRFASPGAIGHVEQTYRADGQKVD